MYIYLCIYVYICVHTSYIHITYTCNIQTYTCRTTSASAMQFDNMSECNAIGVHHTRIKHKLMRTHTHSHTHKYTH